MGKRRRRKGKFKPQKGIVYFIFAFGFLGAGGFGFASFFLDGEMFLQFRALLQQNFGSLSYLAPIAFLLLGFLFLRIKLFLSRPHIIIGFLLAYMSFLGLLKTGSAGQSLAKLLTEI